MCVLSFFCELIYKDLVKLILTRGAIKNNYLKLIGSKDKIRFPISIFSITSLDIGRGTKLVELLIVIPRSKKLKGCSWDISLSVLQLIKRKNQEAQVAHLWLELDIQYNI